MMGFTCFWAIPNSTITKHIVLGQNKTIKAHSPTLQPSSVIPRYIDKRNVFERSLQDIHNNFTYPKHSSNYVLENKWMYCDIFIQKIWFSIKKPRYWYNTKLIIYLFIERQVSRIVVWGLLGQNVLEMCAWQKNRL